MTVFGNKDLPINGAYVQQLRDGHDDFFVNFIEVRDDLSLLGSQDLISSLEVEILELETIYMSPWNTSSFGRKNRPSVSITFDTFTERESWNVNCFV
ncbi:MAG: hypothetical protein R3A13_05110 [Bdellovibrionota bacterium]